MNFQRVITNKDVHSRSKTRLLVSKGMVGSVVTNGLPFGEIAVLFDEEQDGHCERTGCNQLLQDIPALDVDYIDEV